MSPEALLDPARSIAILVLVLSTLPVVLVLVLYTRAYRLSRHPMPDGERPDGLVPGHVALVSLYAIGAQWTLVWGLSEQLSGGPPSPSALLARCVIYTLLGLVLITAVLVIGAKGRTRRVRFRRGRIVSVKSADEVEIRDNGGA